ncbi:MAG: pilin [Candidatus Paceibacterota bacterium]|jgi:hypothetical protein
MKIFKTKKYSILSNILKFSFVIMFVIMLTTPVIFVNACGGLNEPPCPEGSDISSNEESDVSSNETGLTIDTKINNPLGPNITDIPSFIQALVEIVLIVGIPIVALAIIYTGFLFVTAQGNSEKITKAKKALLYTLIGAALLLGAFVIAQAIGKTVEEIKSTT